MTSAKRLSMLLALVIGCLGCSGSDGVDVDVFFFSGFVDGDSAGGLIVVLSALDADGESIGVLGSSATDTEGNFTINLLNDITPSSSLQYSVATSAGDLRAFVTSDSQEISAATTGVAAVIGKIVGTEGDEVTVASYANGEIEALVATASDSILLMAPEDVNDHDAVVSQISSDLGEAIADASGSDPQFLQSPVPQPQPAEPENTLTSADSFFVQLFNDAEWDIEPEGSISDGTNDAYDGAFFLSVGNEFYTASFSSDIMLEDAQEVVLPVIEDLGEDGLSVSRRIFVPEEGRFARFLETLTNTTASAITLDVAIEGNLGSDDSEIFGPAFNGSVDLAGNLNWHTSQDAFNSDPALGFFYPGAVAVLSGDNFEYTYSDVTIPAGQTVTIVHFAFQDVTSLDIDGVAEEIDLLFTTAPDLYFEGLTETEIDQVLGFFNNAGISGPAGTVAPGAEVTATNTTTNVSATGTANDDGSFAITINAESGEAIQITTDLGRDETLLVP